MPATSTSRTRAHACAGKRHRDRIADRGQEDTPSGVRRKLPDGAMSYARRQHVTAAGAILDAKRGLHAHLCSHVPTSASGLALALGTRDPPGHAAGPRRSCRSARGAGEDDESCAPRSSACARSSSGCAPTTRVPAPRDPPAPSRCGARVLLLTLGCLLFAVGGHHLGARRPARHRPLRPDRGPAGREPRRPAPGRRPDRRSADRRGQRGGLRARVPAPARRASPRRSAARSMGRSAASSPSSSRRRASSRRGTAPTPRTLVIELVTGEQVGSLRLEGANVVLDLGELIERVKARLHERGLGPLVDRIPLDVDRDVVLFNRRRSSAPPAPCACSRARDRAAGARAGGARGLRRALRAAPARARARRARRRRGHGRARRAARTPGARRTCQRSTRRCCRATSRPPSSTCSSRAAHGRASPS